MENEWDDNKPGDESAAKAPSAEGIVEAVTQDVELIVDKVMDTAAEAVVVVQETLGIRKPKQPRAKAPAKKKGAKPKARATMAKALAAKARPSKSTKTKARTAKPVKKIAKAKAAKPKRAAKPAPKARKAGRKR
ncbi:MAG TPA: hypothetical protein VKR29_04335 [Candidatus Binataceae bacterium]|nr:hypothetical protein [Candidatus Binataceae bacterium]